MYFISMHRLYCKKIILLISILLYICIDTYGEPTIKITPSFSGTTITYTVNATGLPELKCITLVCTYDSQSIQILDAIVSAPVPATAFSVLLEKENSSVTFTVLAASTVTIENNKTILIVHIPSQTEENIPAFTFNKASINDKNDAVSEVAIHQGVLLRTPRPQHLQHSLTIPRILPVNHFQLNGRRVPCAGINSTAGFYIKRNGAILPAGYISIK